MMPPRLPSIAEFQKRECRDHLGANLRYMTSARSPMAESITQKVWWGAVRGNLGGES